MIDLSFLTEEEQEAIMKVLQRDAELKRAEEERVRHLPEKIKDDVQLKNMSGQWFYEAKSKRHRDKIHGADIIRASMRRKPATLAEVSQNKSNKVKNSWVSNVNKEVFVPPELHGIVEHQDEQPQLKSSSSSKPMTSMLDKPEERFMKAAVSPVKQRRNPFNSTASGDNLASGESENRPTILPQLSNKEILSLSEESQPKPNLENDEMERSKKPFVEPTDESQKGQVKHPVPKARKLIHKATDAVSQREGFVPKPAKRTERVNGISTPPRGILKRTSSSSSTDSEVRVSQMLDVQKKNALPTVTIFEGEAEKNSPKEEVEDSAQISLEKLKQVRFSSSTGKGELLQSPQLHHGREKGEFDLLESDEIKSSGNDAIRADSFRSKQISAVKPSSALQVKTIDGLQDDTLASGACDTNKSVFLVNQTLQSKTVTPKKLETPQKTSSNIKPDSNNELGVDEMRENKVNQFLSRESKLHNNFTDEHQLSAKTEAREVSNTNSTSLQQGKPDLVEERDAKTTFKPDKHVDELMKVADEPLSKVLDWFERSSGTEDRKHVSARSQGREPKEVDFSARTVALPTEHSGCSMDGKTEVVAELPFRKIKQQNTISSTPFILENIQLIKERMKPKKEEENEKQNDKSLTEFDCTRDEEKEHGQEIMQQNEKLNLLEHEEQKPPAQKCESEKAIQEKRRIREIRAFWERNKTIPSHEEKQINININAAGGGALKGLRESDKIKPTAEYLSNRLDDQSKNMLRSGELSCASQASINEHQNSFEFGPGHVVEQPERTLASDEVHEFTELPKIVNLQPRLGATLFSLESEDKDEKEALKGKAAACSQQKPSFRILSLKEKINEKSKNQISDPSQFQSLRDFWDTRVKLQSSIDRGDASLSVNASLIKLGEDEGSVNVTKQELIQQQTQILEQEQNQKLDSVVHALPVGSSTLNGLNMTYMKNTDSVQLDRKLVISKPREKLGLPEQEIKECIEKSTVLPKETPVSLQLLQLSGDKDTLKEKTADYLLSSPIEKVENKTAPLDISLPKEEVAETVDKVILPKAELDMFKLGLKKLEKEASEVSSDLKLKENILKGTTFHSNQCKVSERTAEQTHDTSHSYQKEEISKSIGKANVLSTDDRENVKSFKKEFREFEPFCLRHEAADKDDTLGCSQRHQGDLQNLLRKTIAFQPEYRKMGIKSLDDTNSISETNRSVQSTFQEDADQPEEVNETIEKSVAPSKFNRLTPALEKLLEEASETPPLKPKRSDGTVQKTVEMEGKTYECDGELPQEIRETVEKSFAPSQVSGLASALEKLVKEASEMPPAKPKRADSTVQRTVEMEVKSMTYDHNRELLQEIRETIEKSVTPSKVSGLCSALEKLLKEASESPPDKPKHADNTVQRTVEVEVKSMTSECDEELPEEIRETIEKSVVPSKVSGLTSALNKLLKEASQMPPAKPKRADSTVQRAAEIDIESMTSERAGELPEEIRETIEKSIAPSKVSGLTSALEKLLKGTSEMPPAKRNHADGTVQGTVDMQVRSTTCEHNGELPQEIRETIEKSVAPSKVSGLTSSLEKLLKEASEMPPAKPKRADGTIQRIVEMEVKSMTSEHDGALPQEIRETIEKSVAPLKGGSLTSALEKLLEEASEVPPAKLKHAEGTVQGTVDMQLRSMTSEHDGELPREIRETIEKFVAPSRVSDLTSALEKLLEEASVMSPAKPKRSDGTVQRAAEMDIERMTSELAAELPEEIRETIEKSVAPSRVSDLTSALEKLLKEASEMSPAKPKRSDGTVQRIVETEGKSMTYEHDRELLQEIREAIEKSVAPSKVSNLTSALEKLLEEASEMPPAKPKHSIDTVQKTVEVEGKTYECDGELPKEIRETIEKSVAPSRVSGLTSALEKLLEEASEKPAKPKGADNTVQKTVKMEFKSTTYEHDRELPEKIGETILRSALSKYDCRVFDVELLDEVSETPASVLKNMDKKTPGKIHAGQSVHPPHQQGRGRSQEIEEIIEKTSVSNTAKFSVSSEKLLQEPSETSSPVSKELHKQEKFGDHMFPSQKATLFVTMSQPYSALSSYHTQMKIAIKGGPPEQNIKTSINDLAISEIEVFDLPERNRAINKIEERNMAPVDLSPLEGETNMIAIKPFEINEEGRRDESTSLDDSVNNSEFKTLLKFRRASTPLKDESNSFQSEGAQLCLMSPPEDNDEGEENGSNLGFKFSDENFDSHSGTGSSIRSEEELNPVLMALKRSADRKMPSKSLEDIPSATSNKGKIKNTKEELALSAEDVSTVPSQPDKLFSHPEKLKGLSKSVPSFLQEESDDRETDTASESSYSLRRIKKSPSSLTNLSGSSGMASLSSVSSSLMSIYSADFGNVDVKGNIQFAIDYVEQLNELHILICQCKDLAVADVKRQRSDPYVKTYLLPEKYKLGKRKTSVKKKTFNPVYNEILRYKIEKGLLKNQSLNISVWHNDTFGRNSFLGEVELDLGTWDWNDKSNKQINWYPLKPRTSTMALEPENRGEMKLALQYVPHPVGGKKTLYTGEVHIWVKECHDLPILRGNRLNSFIKCTVLPDTSRKSRQKTRTVAKTTNPVFNHTMVYDGFRPEDLKEACIELTVWDHHKLANHFLGGLRIGLGTGKSYGTTVDWMDSTSDESALWEKMMNSPNTWIEDTLPLRMLMVAKLTK